MNRALLALIVVVGCGPLITTAQLQNSNWHFGQGCSVSLTSGAPVVQSGSIMSANEGCAALSDNNGNLLFYTNGRQVFNSANAVMPGPLLAASPISTQAALIVQHPGNSDQYFLFTTDTWEFSPTDLRYSIVDMSLNGGLGGITPVVNVLVNPNIREQVAATQHANGQDHWIVTHEANNQEFLAYRLTPQGLDTVPVISVLGMDYTGINRWGGLRFSSDCKTLAAVLGNSGGGDVVQIFDFDNATGNVFYPRTVATFADIPGAYSAEFSPTGTRLYVTGYNTAHVYQYDLNSSNIPSTAVDIAVGYPGTKCGLLLANDGKLYVGNPYSSYLDVVEYPEVLGTGCGFVNNAVTLSGSCGLALPNQERPCMEIISAAPASLPQEAHVGVHPVPFTTTFTVEVRKQGLRKVGIRLFDSLGQLVAQQQHNAMGTLETKVDPGPIPVGVYFLECNVDGTRTTRRVVKY